MRKNVLLMIILLISLGLPFLVTNNFYLHVITTVFIYAGLASSWNILGGYAGQLSLGHTAFFGIGAYTSTLLYLYLHISPWIGMIIGGILAVLLGFLTLYPSFKLQGVFFAMVTVSFGEVVRMLFVYFRNKTSIPYGISIPYEPSFANMIFEGKMGYYYVGLAYMIIIALISYKVKHSRLGYYLNALKENEDAAQALGVNTGKSKLYALVISAFFTAIGGTVMAQYILYIEPDSVFSHELSIELPLMVIIGGVGSVWGPILGAFIVTPLGELLRAWFSSIQGLNLIIYGLILIIVVLRSPNGLIAYISFTKNKLSRKKNVKEGGEYVTEG